MSAHVLLNYYLNQVVEKRYKHFISFCNNFNKLNNMGA